MHLDYSVSFGPFMRFEFLSEMFDHSVHETRDPSLTIFFKSKCKCIVVFEQTRNMFVQANL